LFFLKLVNLTIHQSLLKQPLLHYTLIAMKKILFILIGLGIHLCAEAEIYKHVDADGRVTYTNVPMKGAVKTNIESPASSSSSDKADRPSSSTPTPANFPRVDKEDQKQRDDKRRQILQEELAQERQALEEAKKNLAEGETKPEVFRGKDGKTYRNVAKFQEKMDKLQEEVSLHEKNIGLLEKELSSLK
jgi:hypothetical protein